MKRIALGLFLAGMAVGAANAVELRAVASKGYVDTIAGSLSLLSTRDKTSLVSAINELVGRLGSFELLSNKTTTIDSNSTDTQYPSAKAVYDTAIVPLANKEDKSNKTQTIDANSTTVQYPSAKAVYDAIQEVSYHEGTDIDIDDDNKINATYESLNYTTSGNGPTEGLEIGYAYISRLDQVNGKIKATQQGWTDIFTQTSDNGGLIRDPNTFTGIEERIPASAGDIVRALLMVRGEIPSLDGVEAAVDEKQDKSTDDYQVGAADGTWRTLTTAEKAALQSGVTSDTVGQVANKVDLDQGPENKHKVMVTDETGKVIPAPLEACSDERSKCVLTFGVRADGTVGYEWEVIAR